MYDYEIFDSSLILKSLVDFNSYFIFFHFAQLQLSQHIMSKISILLCLTIVCFSFEFSDEALLFRLYSNSLQVTAGCSPYSCKTSTQVFSNTTCLYFDVPSSIYYAQPCTGGLTCTPDSYPSQNWTCTQPAPYPNNFYPGEKCTINSDCLGGSCVTGICAGIRIGEPCTTDGQCNPGSSCQVKGGNMICYPYVPAGHVGCMNDFDCAFGAACFIGSATNATLNYCLRLGSLNAGSAVTTCQGNQNVLCSSGTCASFSSSFVCTSLLASPSTIPVYCEAAGTGSCRSSTDSVTGYSIPGFCQCGLNPTANGYCNLNPGDAPYVKYQTYLNLWYSSTSIQKCNTYRRYMPSAATCMKQYWDSKSYENLINSYRAVSLYPSTQGASSCVVNTLFPSYSAEKEATIQIEN